MPPVTQKLIAGIAVFVVLLGGIGAGIYAKTNENAEIQVKIDALNEEIGKLDARIAQREALKKLRAAQDDIFKELVAILPQENERQQERVWETLTAYASVAKLTPIGLVPIVKPVNTGAPAGAPPPPSGQAAPKDFAQTELRIQYSGTFFNFLKFLNLVENNESFLRVDEIQLSPAPTADTGPQPEHRLLSIIVKISTFHYVSK